MEEGPPERSFADVLEFRRIHGGIPNTAPTLFDQCVRSIHRYIKGDGLPRVFRLDFPSLPTKLLERLLDTMLLSCEKLPSQMLPQILSRHTAHLDTCKFEPIELSDLLSAMRTAGVEKLQSFLTSPVEPNPRIRVQELVPNERLTVLYMRQLHCCNDQLAILAIKFPLLAEASLTLTADVSRCGFDHLSKLKNLRKFCFWNSAGVSEQLGDDKLALLLQTLPKLHCAKCLHNFPDNGRLMDITSALNACSKPLLLREVSVLPALLVRPLCQIVPEVTKLDLINHQTATSHCLGLNKVTELSFSGYFTQVAFDLAIDHYGPQLKVLKMSRERSDVELSLIAQKCPSLEWLECSSDSNPLPVNFLNPWPCLRHLVVFPGHLQQAKQIFIYAENIQYLHADFVDFSDSNYFWAFLNVEERKISFPNVTKALLMGVYNLADVTLFLCEAPKLQQLTLTDWPDVEGDCWLHHVPGLHVKHIQTF